MAFLEQRLDPRIERGATGGPTNDGRMFVRTPNRTRQVFTQQAPLHRYEVGHGLRDQAGLDALLSLWYVVHFTPYEGFRFRDWSDYRATQANSTLTLISGSTWQLHRVYTFASIQFLRTIRKPVAGVAIWRTRAGLVSAASASVDTATGIATISGHAAGDTYTWSGEFDVPVTFTSNEWTQQLEAMNGQGALASMPMIQLEEIQL